MIGFTLYTLAGSRRSDCHCTGTGLVFMDDRDGYLPEPCPMCTLGSQRSAEFVAHYDQTPPALTKDLSAVVGMDVDPPRIKHISQWRNRDGKPIQRADYYEGVDVTTLTWEHGLTGAHQWHCSHQGCFAWVNQPNTCCIAHDGTTRQNAPDLRAILEARGVVRPVLTDDERAALQREIDEERAADIAFHQGVRDDAAAGAA